MSRALFIHAGAIGDSILALRVVAALRRSGFDEVVVLGRPLFAELAPPPEGPDAVWDIETGGFHALFSADAPISPTVQAQLRGFDLAVDMLAGPAGSLAHRLKEVGISRAIAIDSRPRADWPRHVTEQWLADLRAAGLDTAVGPPRISVSEDKLLRARDRLTTTAGSSTRVPGLIHPGSGGRAKCWPLRRFVELATTLNARGVSVLFLIGPVELDRLTCDDLARLREAAPVITAPSLSDTAALTAAASLYIGNDSGISHLAAACGTPSVIIFGPSNPRLYAPLGRQVTILESPSSENWPAVMEVLAVCPA